MRQNVTGSVREVRPGVWEITIDLGFIDGKRERRYHTVHVKGKRRANAELRKLITRYEDGTISTARLSTGEYLRSWFVRHKKPRKTGKSLAASTIVRYNTILERHLIPGIGHIPLKDLNAIHIEDHYDDTQRLDGKKGEISPTTLLQHHRVLKCALSAAVRRKLIQFNPCDGVEDVPVAVKRDYIIPTTEQVLQILKETRDRLELFIPIYIAITTGLRRGEIFALKWHDINLQDGYLNVKYSFCTTTDDLKETKTEVSAQRVALLPSTIPMLRRLSREQKENMLACGYYVNDGWLCCWKNGEHIHPDYITKNFPKLTEEMGIGHMWFHDLRHTHGTWLIESGVDIKSVSDRLRHTTVSTTEGYTHLGMKHRIRVAEQADTVLRGLTENL